MLCWAEGCPRCCVDPHPTGSHASELLGLCLGNGCLLPRSHSSVRILGKILQLFLLQCKRKGLPRVTQGSAAEARPLSPSGPSPGIQAILGGWACSQCCCHFLAPPGSVQGTLPRGVQSWAWASPGLFPSLPSSPQATQVPLSCGKKAAYLSQEQLGLVPSAVAWRLSPARQSRLCPGGPGADGSTLAQVQEPWGALGLGGWAPRELQHLLLALLHCCEPALAKGGKLWQL